MATKPTSRIPDLQTTEGNPPSRFLDLPIEVRMMIYDHFYDEPLERQTRGEIAARKSAAKARAALLRVSKQVNVECTPRHFNLKTFLVNPEVPKGNHPSKSNCWKGYNASNQFGQRFLKTLPSSKLQSIRAIEYDLDWARRWGRDGTLIHSTTEMDVEGALNLAKVLRESPGVLQCLEKVTLSGHQRAHVFDHDFAGFAEKDYPARWWELVTMLGYVWKPD